MRVLIAMTKMIKLGFQYKIFEYMTLHYPAMVGGMLSGLDSRCIFLDIAEHHVSNGNIYKVAV